METNTPPDHSPDRDPRPAEPKTTPRPRRHDQPVEFPVSETAVSQADGVP